MASARRGQNCSRGLGLFTLNDLIGYFPRAYEDRSRIHAIADAPMDANAAIRAAVASPVRTAHIRKGLDLSKVTVTDGKSLCELVFFNQSYIRGSLKEGEEYLFFGRMEGNLLRRSMQNPSSSARTRRPAPWGASLPSIHSPQGLSKPAYDPRVDEALAAAADELPDPLPQALRQRTRSATRALPMRNSLPHLL
jgi:ATP-dependent DNA helicase RecG